MGPKRTGCGHTPPARLLRPSSEVRLGSRPRSRPLSFPGLPELSMVLPVPLASAPHEAVKESPAWDCVQWSWAVPGFRVTSFLCGNREYIPYMSPDGPIVGEGESHVVGVQWTSGGSLTNLL